MITKSGSVRASTAAEMRVSISSAGWRRSLAPPHVFRVDAVFDVDAGDPRLLKHLHRAVHVECRLAALIGVGDHWDGDRVSDPRGDLDHLGHRDQTPVLESQVHPSHHVAAGVDCFKTGRPSAIPAVLHACRPPAQAGLQASAEGPEASWSSTSARSDACRADAAAARWRQAPREDAAS